MNSRPKADASLPIATTISPEGQITISLPPEAVRGFLTPFSGRARVVLAGLLQGYSRGMAAAAAGISNETVRLWGKKDPEFARALEQAREWGFSRGPESELFRRAFAGEQDRGSMRALELIVKAGSPEYREKVQQRLDVVHHAERMMATLADGWRDDTLPSSTSPEPPRAEQR